MGLVLLYFYISKWNRNFSLGLIMTFIINKINTKEELDTLVNIKHLFEQSESYIDEHAQLPPHILSREEKFSYVKNIFADCCAREKWFIYHVKRRTASEAR